MLAYFFHRLAVRLARSALFTLDILEDESCSRQLRGSFLFTGFETPSESAALNRPQPDEDGSIAEATATAASSENSSIRI